MSIIVLCLISAVVVHNKKGNEVYELIIGLLMLIFSLLVTIISFIFEYRLGAARLEAYLVIVWLYFFTGISIILSDQNVNNVLMQGSEFTGYMSSINSLIVLAVVTKKKAQKLKNYYVMVNIMLAIV